MNILEVNRISKAVKGTTLLQEVSFSIESGEILSLIGPEHAGKSALLHIIARLAFPDSGSVTVCGENIRKTPQRALSHLSFLSGKPALYSQLTGREHLQMAASLRGKGRKTVEEALAQTGLDCRAKKKVKSYAAEEKLSLSLAMCLLAEPELLLLEEPEKELNQEVAEKLCRAVSRLTEQGTGVLIAARSFGELQKISHSFLLLEAGRIEEKLSPEDFRIASGLEQLGGAI